MTGKSRTRGGQPTLAERADKHQCYQQSVQAPEADLDFFTARFEEMRGRQPVSLREDFCGTAYLSSVWLSRQPGNTALCVDLDATTLAWGRQNNFDPTLLERATVLEADVRQIDGPAVDMACAMNFSFCALKRRDDLKRYFQAVSSGLKDDGIFFCELYGGTEAIVEIQERRQVENYTFVWHQASFNPITNETVCQIHFEFEDGSSLQRAFTYDWRLWSIAEVRDVLKETGFRSIDVYWEAVDENGEGTGDYRLTSAEENQEGWLVLIVAGK